MDRPLRKPEVSIDVPKVDDVGPVLPAVPEALDDLQKRWLIAGICIHSVISPTLREFVKPVFESIYTSLVRDESIDAQTYKPNVTHYPINGGKELNYECINNNKAIVGPGRKQRFDYAVRSAVDLSKLFLQTHMCFHSGFDDSCDLSALLAFFINVTDFDGVHRFYAQEFKHEIRNDWAHCNFTVWTEKKLADAFVLMEDFICSLQLTRDEETNVLNKLRDWITDGQSFLSGSTLGLELVQSLMDHTRKFGSNLRTLAEQTKDEFKENSAALEKIRNVLLTFEDRFKDIKFTLMIHEGEIMKLKEQTDRNRERDTQERLLFQVPHRTEFVGRVDILQQVENTLIGSNVDTNKLVLCGLGGIGKTSIAVEYIWKHQTTYYPGGVFWISGESGEAFEISIRCLASRIGTLMPDSNVTYTKTYDWISLRQGRCLVVIDNVDEDRINDPVIILVEEHNVILGENCHLVITTRRSKVKASADFSRVKCIPVDVLSDSESIEFFKRTLGDVKDSDDDVAAMCNELQGLPLAIEQAAKAIRQLKCTVSDYLKEFKKVRIEIFDRPLSSNVSHIGDVNKQSIRTIWTMNIENIKKKADNQGLTKAIDLLLPLVARLARDDIMTDILNEGNPRLKDDQLTKIFASEFRKRQVVYLFTEYSILTENSDQTLRIHSLVQDAIREYCKDATIDLSYVGKCAFSMLQSVIRDAARDSNIALLVKGQKHCIALRKHFEVSEDREDIWIELQELELYCFKRQMDIHLQKNAAIGAKEVDQMLVDFVHRVEVETKQREEKKKKARQERELKEREAKDEEEREKVEEANRVADEKIRLMNEAARVNPKIVPSPNLQVGWEKKLDSRTMRYFYVNHNDGTTQWEPPSTPGTTTAGSNYTTKLKEEPKETRRGLRRSYSSPNIAQMLEDESKGKKIPSIDRGNKPIKRVEAMPKSRPMPVKGRDLYPVYGNVGRALTGLRNLGNTCYMNSTIQCLNNTSPLVTYLLTDMYLYDINRESPLGNHGEVVDELGFVVKALWSGQYRFISPRDFKSVVGKSQPMFAGFDQQDTQEFLTFLLDGLHEGLNKVKTRPKIPEQDNDRLSDYAGAELAWKNHKLQNESIIVELFQGQLKSTIMCLSCRKQSVTFEAFMFLSLPITSALRCTLQECLWQFSSEEKMTGSSRWKCPQCACHRDSVKKIEIWKVPRILLIALNRFVYEGQWRTKINAFVDFPIRDLKLDSHVKEPPEHPYNLYAVSNHFGSLDGGHYTASCKNPCNQQWYKYDDHEVYEMSESNIKTSAAYVLYYTSIEFTPPEFRPSFG